jgi:hypothetical protein
MDIAGVNHIRQTAYYPTDRDPLKRSIMKTKQLIIFLLCCLPLVGQTQLPIIKANSNQIIIRDGHTLIKGQRITEPQYRPDVYRTIRSDSARVVTFYTDLDSISCSGLPKTSDP